MTHRLRRRSLWLPLLALIWVGLALLLTMQSAQTPLVHLMRLTIARTELGATIGHAGLFGVVMLLVYFGLRTVLSRRLALLLALAITLLLGTGTEFYQIVLSSRDASLTDLLANWLGAFVIGFALLFGQGFRQG